MIMLPMSVFLFLSLLAPSLGQSFNPIAFTLPSPPSLTGALSPNYALYNAEKLHSGKIMGPTSFAFLNGNVYTVTADRKVVNIATCDPTTIADLSPQGCRTIAQCGLLVSIRVDTQGMLLVLDAYRGLFRVNPTTGAIEQLYSSTTPIGGRVPKYLNGMVQSADGTILISDSSDRFDAINDIYIIMEGRPTGRILAINPTTKSTTEVLREGFVYPNGLEITADGTKLLVAESGRARILTVGITQQTWRQIGVFSQNLPGLPGNIRRSSRGTYWVGLSYIRHSGIQNSMDIYSNNPAARQQTVFRDSQQRIRSYYPRYGMVVELDGNGNFIGSLHDPTGYAYSSVSEASENEGLLYIGSQRNRFTGRIVLPQGDGRVVTIDSVIQVLRSRCQIPENRLAEAKQVLTQYINNQAQQSGAQQPAGTQTTGTQTTGTQTTGTQTTGTNPTGTQPTGTNPTQPQSAPTFGTQPTGTTSVGTQTGTQPGTEAGNLLFNALQG